MAVVATSLSRLRLEGSRPRTTTAATRAMAGMVSLGATGARRTSRRVSTRASPVGGVIASRPKKARFTSSRKYTAVRPEPTIESSVATGNTVMLPRNTRNSEMKPAMPGRPALAITPTIISEPVKGRPFSGLSRPRSTSRSRVPVLR